MSDSDLSDAPSAPLPPDSELEQALRKQVRDALKTGDDAAITVSSTRKAAEEALGLEVGFYKNSAKWKEESKRIVHEAFQEYGADPSSPAKPKPRGAKPAKPVLSKKRSSPENVVVATKKRRKVQSAQSSEEVLSSAPSQLSEKEEPPSKKSTKESTKKSAAPRNPSKAKTTPKHVSKALESELSEAEADADADAKDETISAKNPEASDSELSVLIDEEPKPRKKRKNSTSAAKPNRKPPAPKTKSEADNDPDQAEIKRLQGWLVKCGIRKLWGKELKPFETPNAKMKHLKEMLADAGMSGRYSVEKASQIKEQRELRADIEAVQQGAERWGKNPEEDEDGDADDGQTKPKRRLVRGAQVLDFLSSDGEETD